MLVENLEGRCFLDGVQGCVGASALLAGNTPVGVQQAVTPQAVVDGVEPVGFAPLTGAPIWPEATGDSGFLAGQYVEFGGTYKNFYRPQEDFFYPGNDGNPTFQFTASKKPVTISGIDIPAGTTVEVTLDGQQLAQLPVVLNPGHGLAIRFTRNSNLTSSLTSPLVIHSDAENANTMTIAVDITVPGSSVYTPYPAVAFNPADTSGGGGTGPTTPREVVLGVNGVKKVQVTDGDGTKTVFSLSGKGQATVTFDSGTFSLTRVKDTVVLSAVNLQSLDILTTGTSTGSKLTATTVGGDGQFTIRSIGVGGGQGDLGAVTMPGVIISSLDAHSVAGVIKVAAITAGGSVGIGTTGGDVAKSAGAKIEVGSIGAVSISVVNLTSLKGVSFDGVTVQATKSIGDVSLQGAWNGGSLTSAKTIKSIKAGSLSNVSISAGGASNPQVLSQYAPGSSLGKITAGAFAGVALVALKIGPLSVGTVGAGSRIQGLNVASFKGRTDANGAFSFGKLVGTSDLDAKLAAKGVTSGLVSVDLIPVL